MILCVAFLLIFFVSDVSLAKISRKSDERIRNTLLGALRRFHLNQPPFISSVSMRSLESVPVVLSIAYSENVFSFADLHLLSQTQKSLNLALKEVVRHRLFQFNPHFVTEDELTNNLLFSIITDHFKNTFSLNRSCPIVHDELQLLTMKVVFNQVSFESFDKTVFYYILSFFHEILYGIDAVTPFYRDECMIEFVRRRMLGFDLPMSLEFITHLEHPDLRISPTWESDLRLFPSLTPREIFTTMIPRIRELSIECFMALTHLMLDKFSDDELFTLIFRVESINSYTPNIFARFAHEKPSDELFDIFLSALSHIQNFKFKTEAALELKKIFSHEDPRLYFYTRSSVDHFSLSDYLFDDMFRHIEELATAKALTLAQMQMFSEIIRSPEISTNDLSRILRSVYIASNEVLFDILMKEHKVPLNIFFRNASKTKVFPVWTGIENLSSGFSNLFMKHLNPLVRDPLIFIAMDKALFQAIVDGIRDRFDWDRVYSFNLSSEELRRFIFGYRLIRDFAGKTASFRDVIDSTCSIDLKKCLFPDINEIPSSFSGNPISVNGEDLYSYFITNE
jgi:hypothetical protein